MIRVTAQDVNNNTVTNYSGVVHIASNDSSATYTGDATLTDGLGFFGVDLRQVGHRHSGRHGQSHADNYGQHNHRRCRRPASHFAVSAPANAVTGIAFAVTVTAEDAFNNTGDHLPRNRSDQQQRWRGHLAG